MQVSEFYKDHWTEYPLELQGVIQHLTELFPEGVKGKKVLDAGSGSGMVSIAFAVMGASVTGVDITSKCIENGRKRAKAFGVECRFVQSDLTMLDLHEDFDIIYSWGVLHHTADAKASFFRLVEHLRPGGEIIIAVYLRTAFSSFWNFSRVFYQSSPGFAKTAFRRSASVLLNGYDAVRKALMKKERYMLRGTSNEELVNDWFGVPHRTFHTYTEVYEWFREKGLDYRLVNPATGRFKSTSNFVVRGSRPLQEHKPE